MNIINNELYELFKSFCNGGFSAVYVNRRETIDPFNPINYTSIEHFKFIALLGRYFGQHLPITYLSLYYQDNMLEVIMNSEHLNSLEIYNSNYLKFLPDLIDCLTSVKELNVDIIMLAKAITRDSFPTFFNIICFTSVSDEPIQTSKIGSGGFQHPLANKVSGYPLSVKKNKKSSGIKQSKLELKTIKSKLNTKQSNTIINKLKPSSVSKYKDVTTALSTVVPVSRNAPTESSFAPENMTRS
jgi:hypothetical protein